MATATTLIGIYLFTIFVYDIMTTEELWWAPDVFLRLGMICALIGGTLFFFTMQCMVNSTSWFSSKIHWIPYIIVDLAAIIFFIATPLIKDITITENPGFFHGRVNLSINMGPLIVMVVILLYYIMFSIIYLYTHGIKKASGASKRKMIVFETGLLIFVTAMFVNTASQFASGSIGIVLDVVNLGMISIGTVFLTASLIYTPKSK